jgi:hypothetical protein
VPRAWRPHRARVRVPVCDDSIARCRRRHPDVCGCSTNCSYCSHKRCGQDRRALASRGQQTGITSAGADGPRWPPRARRPAVLAFVAVVFVIEQVWPAQPRWCRSSCWFFVESAVLGIDAVDWLTHLGNHKIRSLWRLHALPGTGGVGQRGNPGGRAEGISPPPTESTTQPAGASTSSAPCSRSEAWSRAGR